MKRYYRTMQPASCTASLIWFGSKFNSMVTWCPASALYDLAVCTIYTSFPLSLHHRYAPTITVSTPTTHPKVDLEITWTRHCELRSSLQPGAKREGGENKFAYRSQRFKTQGRRMAHQQTVVSWQTCKGQLRKFCTASDRKLGGAREWG